MVAALDKGPFSLDLDFCTDGGGDETPCGTLPSPAMSAGCRAAIKSLFSTRVFAQALRFVVTRGNAVLKPFKEWFTDGTTFEGVSVRCTDVTAEMLVTLKTLVPDENLAATGQGLAAKRWLVYLSAPASGYQPAWDAAFFGVTDAPVFPSL